MSARSRFCQLALSRLGAPVLWGSKGPEAFDCSGLVTSSLLLTGGRDLRQTHNAQALHDDLPALEGAEPLPGDLVFYGSGPADVEHVVIWMVGAKALSADGATSHILSLELALADPRRRVRLHDDLHFRHDLPPVGNPVAIRRNTLVDAIDLVSR